MTELSSRTVTMLPVFFIITSKDVEKMAEDLVLALMKDEWKLSYGH